MLDGRGDEVKDGVNGCPEISDGCDDGIVMKLSIGAGVLVGFEESDGPGEGGFVR